MICQRCLSQIDDNTVCCPVCGMNYGNPAVNNGQQMYQNPGMNNGQQMYQNPGMNNGQQMYGNPGYSAPGNMPPEGPKNNKGLVIALSIIAGVLVIAVIVLALIMFNKDSDSKDDSSSKDKYEEDDEDYDDDEDVDDDDEDEFDTSNKKDKKEAKPAKEDDDTDSLKEDEDKDSLKEDEDSDSSNASLGKAVFDIYYITVPRGYELYEQGNNSAVYNNSRGDMICVNIFEKQDGVDTNYIKNHADEMFGEYYDALFSDSTSGHGQHSLSGSCSSGDFDGYFIDYNNSDNNLRRITIMVNDTHIFYLSFIGTNDLAGDFKATDVLRK